MINRMFSQEEDNDEEPSHTSTRNQDTFENQVYEENDDKKIENIDALHNLAHGFDPLSLPQCSASHLLFLGPLKFF